MAISKNKYFELKKNSWGSCPNSNYFAVFSRKSGHGHVSKHWKPHTESMSTHSFTQAQAHRRRQNVHTFESFLIWLYQTILLVMHMLYWQATLCFKT